MCDREWCAPVVHFVQGVQGLQPYGICSHVLACNHMREEYNVRYNLPTIGKSKAKTLGHGNYKSVPKALKRLPERGVNL